MEKNTGKWAMGALAAGVIGYVAGILTAPKSGKETRADIKQAAAKARAEAEKKLKILLADLNIRLASVKAKGNTLKGKAKEDFDAVYSSAVNMKNKIREILSALHNGEADDPELQKALIDAKAALKSLEKYAKG